MFDKSERFVTVSSLVEFENKIQEKKRKKMNANKFISLFIIGCILLQCADAGPAAYGICQAGCAAVVVACYAGAGAVFGTVTAGAAVPAAVIACNSAYGTCQAACWAALITPTP